MIDLFSKTFLGEIHPVATAPAGINRFLYWK